jgi:hypothetical protein
VDRHADGHGGVGGQLDPGPGHRDALPRLVVIRSKLVGQELAQRGRLPQVLRQEVVRMRERYDPADEAVVELVDGRGRPCR